MKTLVVVEGPSELGGALQHFVERLSSAELTIDQERVSRQELHAHHGKGKGYFKRALRWMFEAQKRGYDAVVLLIDQDDRPERIKEFDDAQDYGEIGIRRAQGIAIRTIDAWILADEAALSTVLGCSVDRQRNPETISDPKSICRALRDESGTDIRLSEMYSAVAATADVAILAKRCPKGFSPFADRVRKL